MDELTIPSAGTVMKDGVFWHRLAMDDWPKEGTLIYFENEVRAALRASAERERELREALQSAILQIEYLHEKFGETGSGNQVIVRSSVLLNKHEEKANDGI